MRCYVVINMADVSIGMKKHLNPLCLFSSMRLGSLVYCFFVNDYFGQSIKMLIKPETLYLD